MLPGATLMLAQAPTASGGLASGNKTVAPTWSPYDSNGGTVLAVAGADYCVAAATTRLSTGLSVLTRDSSCITRISDHCVILSSGFQADAKAVHKLLQARHVMYQHQHHTAMSCAAMSQLLSNTLYSRRFFPYYTATICAGLNEKGSGVVYSYDPVGCCERVGYACRGSGEPLIHALLDSQLQAASPLVLPPKPSVTNLPLEDALDAVRDAFAAAGERDIYTGDSVEIMILTKEGIKTEVLELKKD